MTVKETLKSIRGCDSRLAEARRALAAAEERKTSLEDSLAAALAEGREPAPKDWERAGAAAVEVESRKRAIAKLEAERGKLLDDLAQARVRELREEAGRLEKETQEMQNKAFEALQKAGAALGIKDPVPIALLVAHAILVPSDPRDPDGFGDHFWSVDGSKWVELRAKARELRDKAERIANHPVHRREEIERLLGEEVQNA